MHVCSFGLVRISRKKQNDDLSWSGIPDMIVELQYKR